MRTCDIGILVHLVGIMDRKACLRSKTELSYYVSNLRLPLVNNIIVTSIFSLVRGLVVLGMRVLL